MSVFHPRARDVEVAVEEGHIILRFGPAWGDEVVYYPGDEDHDEQVRHLDRIAVMAKTTRQEMDRQRRALRPEIPR
ncbi:hypothetical protein [Nocardiopsis trehalosi]|uniref:hypothetical protein n=1 Tax=Nocardiopsis trehalosi TaxID=109329 RepID=UPI000835F941|nr:hypothetical protein [Nocardiopsis trehalosi]